MTSSRSLERPTKKATVNELRVTLEMKGLDTKGKKETLWKRLLAAFNRDKSSAAPPPDVEVVTRPLFKQPYKSFLCFDVEATCEPGINFDYPNEIIEFPVVLLQWAEYDSDAEDEDANSGKISSNPSTSLRPRSRRLVKVDTFHSYVRPTWRPILSDFCTSLTGITQDTVDVAPTFPEMLIYLEEWMDSWGLRDGDKLKDAMFVTDGPWDLRDFVPKQLHITPTNPPRYPAYLLGPYLNLKVAVQSVLSEILRREQLDHSKAESEPPASGQASGTIRPGNETSRSLPRITTARVMSKKRRDEMKVAGPNYYLNIAGQLEVLGLGAFKGRQHAGIDDAVNISRILTSLAERDILIEPNGRLPPPKNAKKWPWMGAPGEVLWDEPAVPVTGLPVTLRDGRQAETQKEDKSDKDDVLALATVVSKVNLDGKTK